MALHPSGSAREDVELVVIETSSLSLVIKGKPYHARYEGLKQYQSMDFHDVMQFEVRGVGVESVKVFDVEHNHLIEQSIDHRPIFFENTVYQVFVSPKGGQELEFYHEHPILRKAITPVKIGSSSVLMGNLQFQNEVGLTTLEVRLEEEILLSVILEIFPSKLDYKRDYQKLMEEVNDEIYNLAYHFIKKTYQGAKIKLDGAPSMAEFYRLISVHFRSFIQAVERIEKQPHHQLVKTHVKTRGDQLQRLDSKGRSYLRKNAHVFVDVPRGIHMDNRNVMPMEGLKMKKELTYDTLENRYVKWMIIRITHKLEDLMNKITTPKQWQNSKPDDDLVQKINKMIQKLKGKRNNWFWREIGQLDRSVMSLVLQMAPGYRDAYQIYLTVSKGLTLQGNIYQMSVKDVATLYEYWTYLKLGQILRTKYEQVSQDVVKVNRDGLFVNLDANQSAKRVFKHPITKEKITLTYQKSGGRLPTTSQKPDTMLEIEKKSRDYTFNYVFDAKYRIDFANEGTYYANRYQAAGPLEEDINTMHRYRDSLVIKQQGPYERTAFGAYVLFPWGDEVGYQHHHFYQSINEVNIGGLPFLPNATDLVEHFVENLIDKSPEEIQKDGILPRGSIEEWESSLEEKVLVGVVSTEEQYRTCIQEGHYSILKNQLRKGWQEAKYVALYLTKDVGLQNGVICYGKITNVDMDIVEYVSFEVKSWINLASVIRPVNYGIASYLISTYKLLKEARELPELYMKSKDEIELWRILRRVSDAISIKLNSINIDKATGVMSFNIKDVQLVLHNTLDIIELKKGDKVDLVNVKLLRNNPSQVFRLLVKVL